jgi:hypothetical protein
MVTVDFQRSLRRAIGIAAALLMAVNAEALGQEATGTGERVVPTTQVVISGYGTVGYGIRTQGDNENAFNATVNPIFLFQFQDRILFEAEWEFELEGGVTETGLEYAQLDVMVTDNLTLIGGKFLLPFGVFGERLHPTWINKFPTGTPIYGHHVAAFGAEPLLPIISDLGVMARAMLRPGPLNVTLNGYITQGAAPEDPAEEVAEIVFPSSSEDNNTDKMVGGRLDIGLPPHFELNVSYMNGDYDENNVLDLTGWNVAGEFRVQNVEVRGEYVQTRQEIEEPSGFPTLRRHGFYAQAAYRFGAWEPVFRWTQVFDSQLDGATQALGAWQAGFGLDYWITPSVALMGGYELNKEKGSELDNNRFIVHIAYGF